MKIKAAAKINLTLDILGKREDGYHEIKTIMQSVALFDTVTLTENTSDRITVSCNNPDVPCNEKNIVCKCANAFFDNVGKSCGLHIDIEKNIPTQAGMAGGSADGAAVLVGLNELFGGVFSQAELERIGGRAGADIPFCIRGGTVLAKGTGTELTTLEPMPRCFILAVKPSVGISTAQAYGAVDKRELTPSCATDAMLPIINDIEKVGAALRNDFEDTLKIPELLTLKEQLLNCDGSLGACMSGSGSTVFGIFADEAKVNESAKLFRNKYEKVFVTENIPYGVKIER